MGPSYGTLIIGTLVLLSYAAAAMGSSALTNAAEPPPPPIDDPIANMTMIVFDETSSHERDVPRDHNNDLNDPVPNCNEQTVTTSLPPGSACSTMYLKGKFCHFWLKPNSYDAWIWGTDGFTAWAWDHGADPALQKAWNIYLAAVYSGRTKCLDYRMQVQEITYPFATCSLTAKFDVSLEKLDVWWYVMLYEGTTLMSTGRAADPETAARAAYAGYHGQCIEAKCSTVFMDISPVADGCFVTFSLQLCMFGGQWTWRGILDDTRAAHVESPPRGLPTVDDVIMDLLSRYVRMDPSCATDLYRCETQLLDNPFGAFTSFNDINRNLSATRMNQDQSSSLASSPAPSSVPAAVNAIAQPLSVPSSSAPASFAVNDALLQATLSSLSLPAAPLTDQRATSASAGESLEATIASMLASSSISMAAETGVTASKDVVPGGIIDDIDESFTIVDGTVGDDRCRADVNRNINVNQPECKLINIQGGYCVRMSGFSIHLRFWMAILDSNGVGTVSRFHNNLNDAMHTAINEYKAKTPVCLNICAVASTYVYGPSAYTACKITFTLYACEKQLLTPPYYVVTINDGTVSSRGEALQMGDAYALAANDYRSKTPKCIEGKCVNMFTQTYPLGADGKKCDVTLALNSCLYQGRLTWKANIDDSYGIHEVTANFMPSMHDALTTVVSQYAHRPQGTTCADDTSYCTKKGMSGDDEVTSC